MRAKPLIILIGLLAIITILISIFIYRNNLTFGKNTFQKAAMFACIKKFNQKTAYKNSESKEICECVLTYLFKNYEREYLKNNLDEIIEQNKAVVERCYPDIALPPIDTSKIYHKRGFSYQLGKNEKLTEELYLTKDKDTFLNQYKFYYKNEIDTSKSKFYNLKIEGFENDSILKGTIKFYSPRDTVPLDKIYQRWVTFGFLQGDKDSIWLKEIETDTNVIHFDYVNFDSLTFSGYISDFRFIENDIIQSNKLILNRVYFAIDSEISTNNAFVELLK